ncbi:MAG: prephenate dehydrogenase [Bacteroidaceae bacterium]|nr:prephenate dehydrogenase [Bacteroidaceae bacterium]
MSQVKERTVGVVGLGLIGGSIAKAYSAAGWTVYGFDATPSIHQFAIIEGVLNGVLDRNSIRECSIVHIAVVPDAACKWMQEHAGELSKETLLIDDCGTKKAITELGFELAGRYGFTYVGGHPMAGTHLNGYKNSRASMFQNASMIVVPPTFDDINLFERVKKLLEPMGLKRVVFTTAQDHDRMIAYTSQLPHVVSNAFIKSPTAQQHKGYSAGSFRDLTRVAWLNENMWTELFLDNKEFLLSEINTIIKNLQEYADAMEHDDAARLCSLLRDGRIAKELSEKS